jgi:DNA-binding NarL/FixJ family response regulator
MSRTQQIIALRTTGLTRRQIADHLGISKNLAGVYIHHLLRKSIIPPISEQEARQRRPRASAQVDLAEAKRLRTAGESYRVIGRRYGVSGPTISALIGSTVRITPIQRQLMALHRQGLSYNAIAAKLKKSEGTVAVVVARLVRRGLLPPRR